MKRIYVLVLNKSGCNSYEKFFVDDDIVPYSPTLHSLEWHQVKKAFVSKVMLKSESPAGFCCWHDKGSGDMRLRVTNQRTVERRGGQ